MNTRFTKIVPLPSKPSVKWHLMHEEYYPIFVPERREQVQYWYNKIATGKQRDTFRRVCQEIYTQDPDLPDPEYTAKYTLQVAFCEVKIMLKHYGLVLSDVGKKLARVWILHVASPRDKDSFREVFTGAQSVFIPLSVMKTDYRSPDEDAYEGIDRSNFLWSVDWTNLEAEEKRAQIYRQRHSTRSLSLQTDRPRVTKPKNQFDGFSPLTALGYADDTEEEAINKLRNKLEETGESDRYFTVDGCTVYVAGGSKKANPSNVSSTKHGVIATVYGD
ncbi:hypothetical protein TraAM80_04842 [Trypanosoma rangeli]|uniref:Uncharacterized protein n=1 Tax=Trypanosoma rangeli TaxID=5698 RepID=A0A422NI03_TRYRA|nr:uncharacterized protein TraAM80_04842 [Trypanosoma rangeli]RNF05113.1 hypothetical protein TraAM80_04842 [Trypanosoma rangeli]|eukprot:RNF05113.1 hypothetical protein TraAM80_04842 [Trypanosoma rangeli]